MRNKTKEEHFRILKEEFNGDVRTYLLSMGDFKDVDI